MSDASSIVDLDPQGFSLSEYDNVHITMPAKPALTEEDVDAQLFEYVLSSGKHINSIADLDDAWVQANFDGLSTIDEVREAIVADYDRKLEFEYSDIKYRACCDALIARLSGDVPTDVLENNIEATKRLHLDQLAEMRLSMEQYLREEHLTPEQYEDKVRSETLYQMRLNVALDIMADVLGAQVGNHELTEYLSAPNPEAFLKEIRENEQVEEARRAAVRVKVMRRVIETAVVAEMGEDGQPVREAQPEVPEDDEDIELPDFDNLPKPQIKNDMPFMYTVDSLDSLDSLDFSSPN